MSLPQHTADKSTSDSSCLQELTHEYDITTPFDEYRMFAMSVTLPVIAHVARTAQTTALSVATDATLTETQHTTLQHTIMLNAVLT